MNLENNNKILKGLQILFDIYSYLGNTWKKQAYQNAINIVSKYNKPITSGSDLKHIYGIGKGIIEKIDMILADKNVLETTDATQEDIKNLKAYLKIKSIYGFGTIKAKKLIKEGLLTIDDIEKAYANKEIDLTDDQLIGLKYDSQLQQKIPRAESKKFIGIIGKIIDKYIKMTNTDIIYELVGSYRRGKQYSGDLDLLIVVDNKKQIPDLIDYMLKEMKKMIIYSFTHGNIKTKYMGLIKINKLARHLDIRFFTKSEYPFALLYFTGSQIHNIIIRTVAKRKGYKLNEYALISTTTNKHIKVKNEDDIFKKLGIPYVAPENR